VHNTLYNVYNIIVYNYNTFYFIIVDVDVVDVLYFNESQISK